MGYTRGVPEITRILWGYTRGVPKITRAYNACIKWENRAAATCLEYRQCGGLLYWRYLRRSGSWLFRTRNEGEVDKLSNGRGSDWQSKKEFFWKRYKNQKNRALFVPFVRANFIIGDKIVEDYWLTACKVAKWGIIAQIVGQYSIQIDRFWEN